MLTSFSYIYNLTFICLLRHTNRTEHRRKLENLNTSHTLGHLEAEEEHLLILKGKPFTAITGFFSKTGCQLVSCIIKPVLCHPVPMTAEVTVSFKKQKATYQELCLMQSFLFSHATEQESMQ